MEEAGMIKINEITFQCLHCPCIFSTPVLHLGCAYSYGTTLLETLDED